MMLYEYRDAETARKYMRRAIDGWGVTHEYVQRRLRKLNRFFTFAPLGSVSALTASLKPPAAPVKIPGGWARRVEDDFAILIIFLRSLLTRSPNSMAIIEDPLIPRVGRITAQLPLQICKPR